MRDFPKSVRAPSPIFATAIAARWARLRTCSLSIKLATCFSTVFGDRYSCAAIAEAAPVEVAEGHPRVSYILACIDKVRRE